MTLFERYLNVAFNQGRLAIEEMRHISFQLLKLLELFSILYSGSKLQSLLVLLAFITICTVSLLFFAVDFAYM